ncbi:MAG: PTS fructose transporter subunit IIA [Burkholderiales bacterium]|nr:PTS fructose transporter subunit IIA [Burkholderiales bacterium]MDE1926868.1 PTS fructose transporter subunit IIA [Burkholderiales bacterium]MDE2159927.1 PTS fructose transporter subunit IIA [Burkholderiales bacterium]MDE2505535.1 PTS fructose transporter subunit IIA [Burkholderiales bacterium]
MASILLVAHAPLSASLQAVARHVYPDCSSELAALDIPASLGLEEAQRRIEAALAAMPAGEVLIMADVFGATPCNAALNVADGVRVRVVAGASVPMLWRALCYAALPLADLVVRAVDGGRQGVMQIAAPRRQNQANRPPSDDPDSNPDQ